MLRSCVDTGKQYMVACGPAGRVRITGGVQLHFMRTDPEKYVYDCNKRMGMTAQGLASALQGIQGDAQGPSSREGGPGRSC